MRYSLHFILLLTVILFSGCGESGSTTSNVGTLHTTYNPWIVPKNYNESLANLQYTPAPYNASEYWSVTVTSNVPSASFGKCVDIARTIFQPFITPTVISITPQTTLWLEPVVPPGYEFYYWEIDGNEDGSKGVTYFQNNHMTWTTPAQSNTGSTGITIIMVLRPVGSG